MVVQKDVQMVQTFFSKDEKCITSTSNCYWKDSNDVINSIKTQSQTKKQKIIDWKTMIDYLNEKREVLKHI